MSDEWQEMGNAPKEQLILLDVSLPWPVVGIYNSVNESWAVADLNIGLFEGNYVDAYFETEYEKAPKFWRELPKLRVHSNRARLDADPFLIEVGE